MIILNLICFFFFSKQRNNSLIFSHGCLINFVLCRVPLRLYASGFRLMETKAGRNAVFMSLALILRCCFFLVYIDTQQGKKALNIFLVLSAVFQSVWKPEWSQKFGEPLRSPLYPHTTHPIMFLVSQAVFVCLCVCVFFSSSFKLCKHYVLINLLSCQKINPASAQRSHQLTHRQINKRTPEKQWLLADWAQ